MIDPGSTCDPMSGQMLKHRMLPNSSLGVSSDVDDPTRYTQEEEVTTPFAMSTMNSMAGFGEGVLQCGRLSDMRHFCR